MADDDLIREGVQADFLIQNPAFQDAFNAVSQQAHDSWYSTAANEGDKREQLWHRLKALDDVKLELLNRIALGKAEELKQQAEQNGG